MKKTSSVPRTALARSLKLLRGASSILVKEVGGRLKGEDARVDTMIEQAKHLVATLGDLKGAAMKAGQILSLEASDLLPKEVVDVLRQLHDAAPGMSAEAVEALLVKELGAAGRARLEGLSPEPIAAASIGQVHAAVVDGRPVVVKVQFPGVAKSIDADLGVLKKLAQGLLALQGKAIALDELFAELARGLKAEVDYRREAENLVAYKAAVGHDARFVVPDVFPELSTAKVLTLSREEGTRLGDWLAQDPSEEERRRLGETVLELVLIELFDAGLVQTDPNYGNFLWREAAHRLVLLDFGAVQRYSKAFRADQRELLRLALALDRDGVLEQARRMGLFDPRESYEVQRLFAELIALVVRMFEPESQPWDFGDLAHLEELRRAVLAFARSVRHSAPPKQLAFLNRKLGGMYHLLKDARVKLDLTPFVDRVTSGR